MKKLSINKASVALGSLTATVALLSGLSVADAQTAPGGGSFPGSFLVPGTNTSIGIHGFTLLQIVNDLGPHCGDTNCYQSSPPIEGAGQNPAAHSLKGGFRMDVKPSQFGFETRTPTAYGEVKTFFQFDVNEVSNENYIGNGATPTNTATTGSSSANGAGFGATTTGSSSGELFRLRMAYGTLGPILAGQANSNWLDLQAVTETVDGGGEAGDINTGTQRVAQVRYTFLGGNGLTFAVSAESPQTMWQYATATTFTGSSSTSSASYGVLADNNSANGINYLPSFVGTGNIDQPWGNFAVHGAINPLEIRNSSAVGAAESSVGTTAGHTPDIRKMAFAIGISGHLNTFGKDNIRAQAAFVDGAATYMDDLIGPTNRQGIIWNQVTGQASLQQAYGFNGGYQHWWTDTLRSTLSGGYFHAPLASAAQNWNEYQKGNLESTHVTGHINLIWSPVPFVDMGIEWQSYFRKVASGAEGRVDRVNGVFVFKY